VRGSRAQGNKRAKFDIAHGEANEMKGSLDVALASGYIDDDSAARAKLRRLLALCWGLTHGPHRIEKRSSREPAR